MNTVYAHAHVIKNYVYGIRIPVELGKLMDTVDINWQEEIKNTEEGLRKEIRKKISKNQEN